MFITLIIINNLFEDITLVLCKLFFVILLNSLYLSKYKYVLISVHLIHFYKYALIIYFNFRFETTIFSFTYSLLGNQSWNQI